MRRTPEIIHWANQGSGRSKNGDSLRVLAPVDLRDDSRRSMLTAIELAERWGSPITLLHVTAKTPLTNQKPAGLDAIGLLHSVLHTPAGPTSTRDEQAAQLRRMEQSSIRRMKKVVPADWLDRVHASFAWRYGDVADEIVAYAREHQFDVIVLGKRDYPRPWRFGRTISRRVIQTSPCQVLVAYPSGQAEVERPVAVEAAS